MNAAEHLANILVLVEKRTGMNAATLGGPATIVKAIEHCHRESRFRTIAEWLSSLESSLDAWQTFLHRIVVPETFFFRYPESFEALATAAPSFHKRPLRLLSLPCSTGEEAYSIAITLRRAGLTSSGFTVTGLDIDPRSVEFARTALYHRSSSFRSTDPILLGQEFFETLPHGVAVTETIKRHVTFETRNFWDISSHEEPYDIIFCRNLLIYFSADRQAAALDKLAALLAPEGLLFLGPAEVPVATQHHWTSAAYPMAFACRRAASPPAPPVPVFSAPVLPKKFTRRPPLPFSTIPTPHPSPPPAAHPDALSLPDIRRLADQGDLAHARSALDRHLKAQTPDAESFLLAGLLAESAGNRVEAESFFRKALYLSPNHAEALSHLAWLLQADGRLDASRKLLARAERLRPS